MFRIIRDTFAFLETEFGMAPDPNPVDRFHYASDRIVLKLSLADHHSSNVVFWRPPDRNNVHWLEDVLFTLIGCIDWLGLPEGEEFRSPTDIQDWFDFVADVLRTHAADVLAAEPGSWERLDEVTAERDWLWTARCEAEYEAANGHPYNGPRPDQGDAEE